MHSQMSNLSSQKSALLELNFVPNIIISKSDKDNEIVHLHKFDYIPYVETILSSGPNT